MCLQSEMSHAFTVIAISTVSGSKLFEVATANTPLLAFLFLGAHRKHLFYRCTQTAVIFSELVLYSSERETDALSRISLYEKCLKKGYYA